MIHETLNFIGLVIAVWLFVDGAAPIQWIKKQLNIDSGTKTENIVLLLIMKLVNCALCSGFWFGLAYYQTWEMACIVAFTSELFHRFTRLVV